MEPWTPTVGSKGVFWDRGLEDVEVVEVMEVVEVVVDIICPISKFFTTFPPEISPAID